jgi:hypothetical protein
MSTTEFEITDETMRSLLVSQFELKTWVVSKWTPEIVIKEYTKRINKLEGKVTDVVSKIAIPLPVEKWNLQKTYLHGKHMYVGEYIFTEKNEKIQITFKDAEITLSLPEFQEFKEKGSPQGPFPLTDDDRFEFFKKNPHNLKSQCKKDVYAILGIKNDKRIEDLLDKNYQDAFTTAGYTRCINIETHKRIEQQLKLGVSRADMKEKDEKCGPIFNRRSRNCTNVFNQAEEEEFLRNAANYGKLPQGVKLHEYSNLKTANGIFMKGISFIIRLGGIEGVAPQTEITARFLEYLENAFKKERISENDYEYIKKYHNSSETTIDFVSHKPINISDINDQTYKSVEHSLNFCHILPWKGTNVQNCTYGLTRENRLLGDLSKEQLIMLHITGDGDARRKELIEIIIKNDANLRAILETPCDEYKKICLMRSYLQTQVY